MNMKLDTVKKVFDALHKERNIYDVAREANVSYSYIYRIIRQMKSNGVIKVTKHGRENIVTLTNKGKSIKECVNSVYDALK